MLREPNLWTLRKGQATFEDSNTVGMLARRAYSSGKANIRHLNQLLEVRLELCGCIAQVEPPDFSNVHRCALLDAE